MATKSKGEEERAAHVLIIPYPAQGHMLPLLDLAHLLSHRYGLDITVVVTPRNLPLLSPLLSSSPSVRPLVLPFPNCPSLPPNVENTKDLPHSLPTFLRLMRALSYLRDPIFDWATSLISGPLVAIISDFFLGWTYNLARDLGIPRITFCPSGALALAITNYLWREMPRPANGLADAEDYVVEFECLPNSPFYRWDQLSTVYRSYAEGDPQSEFVKEGFLANIRSWGFVFNTFEGLEGGYLDYHGKDLGHSRVWAVGPLSHLGAGSPAERGGPSSARAEDLLAWLDRREEGSVVYVCFGSQAVLSEGQAEAVAAGLERSGAQFVWCMRSGSAGPGEGFEERTREKGLVVTGWAPQVEVLGHGSVGSFLTHCGWNSVMEGIAAGVVMLTWPMGADQFYNARLLEEEARIGLRVCEGRESVPDPNELGRILAESVREKSEEKARALELREKALAAVKHGGSSWKDADALVENLNMLKGN